VTVFLSIAKLIYLGIKALTNSCTRTIQSGTYFAKKAAKTCPFKLPVSKALCVKRKKQVKFIYLDECKDTKHTNIISLTGVLIDSDKYQMIRNKFYSILNPYIQIDENTINMSPPELHGSNLLPEVKNDAEKLKILIELVEAIVQAKARVYRSGYYATEQLLKLHGGIDGILSLCFLGIKLQCKNEYKNSMLMPVMDSVNKPVFKSFSNTIRNLDILRSSSEKEFISLNNTENICEMHFADSATSSLIQIADITSYLLHAEDYERCNLHITKFKSELIAISKGLLPSIKYNEVIEMNIST